MKNPRLDEAILAKTFSLKGTVLAEASAGTGKTYSIQTLYLRMVVAEGLKVGQVLVVTFTEAATQELRDRLRAILYKCSLAIEGTLDEKDADFKRVKAVLDLSPLAEQAKRVRAALEDFDDAAIYTIHGFCNRVLGRFAFETGHDLSAEIADDGTGALDEVCEDWWRRNTYHASPIEWGIMRCAGITPKKVKEAARKRISRPDAVFRPEGVALDDAALKKHLKAMIKAYDRDAVSASLKKASVNANSLSLPKRASLFGQLDQLASGKTDFKLLNDLEKLTPGFLSTRLNNGSPGLPDHPFFARCEAFVNALETAKRGAMTQIVQDIRNEYAGARQKWHSLTYDDLLLNLRAALDDPRRKDALLDALRKEFAAALIDEFQDTDPVQYGIFRRIFMEAGLPVFLVGDPKQAIYGFRSGDIFTYYHAAGKVEQGRRYELDTNYRSEAGLVKAVNQIFIDGKSPAFINKEITYAGELKARGKKVTESLTISGKVDPAPLKLWYYTNYNGDKAPGQSSSFALRVYADTAAEVARLLMDKETLIAGRPVRPSDIAILVMTHKEGDFLYRELRLRGVPAVRQETGNVFDSQEASDMQILLAAMADPTDDLALRSALATGLFGLTDQEVARMSRAGGETGETGPAEAAVEGDAQTYPLKTLADWAGLFREVHDLWRRGSFISAFNRLAERADIRAVALSREDGERRLTNILQVAEMLHQAESEHAFAPHGTENWLAKQREAATREEDDAYKMRLESDANAVKIMTVFKSKGLQFPIVFVPTMWRRKPYSKGPPFEYHDSSGSACAEAPRHVVHLAEDDEAEERASKEKLEEDVRLFYVAVTRAIHRVYVIWGSLKNNNSAMASVLDHDDRVEFNAPKNAQELQARKETKGQFGAVELVLRDKTDKPDASRFNPAGAVAAKVTPAWERFGKGEPVVDKTHGHASYSALAPGEKRTAGGAQEHYDFDAEDIAENEQDEQARAEAGKVSIFNFPAGTRTGSCWHAIFEALDFTLLQPSAHDEAAVQALIRDQLDRYGLARGDGPEADERRRVVHNMVRNVLTTKLHPSLDFLLADIESKDRVAEMEFNFALRDRNVRTSDLYAVLQKHWGSEPGKSAFLKDLENWDREIPRGYMVGFIDLVFRRDGRYYVLDWKSNRRTGKEADFDHNGICEEMASHAYFLQYLIYLVALSQYLKGSLPGYTFEKNIGGAFHLFLRGMDGSPGRGVYHDRPSQALIEKFSDMLGDFSGTGG